MAPEELLDKEFLSQFKIGQEVGRFLKDLRQVLEKMLEAELDAHWGYEEHSFGNNGGRFHNSSFPKKIQTEHGESVIRVPRDRNGDFEPIIVPKYEG